MTPKTDQETKDLLKASIQYENNKRNNMNDFLPNDYSAPQGVSNYMKFQQGENKIRILSKPIIGWLDWKDKKPYRFRMDKKPDRPMGENPIKHFWAFVVWNYAEQSLQILEITQATIQKSIQDLNRDQDWGAPYDYDIKIVKKGQDLNTEYSVTPSPKKKLDEAIYKHALEKPVNLEALYEGADPWVVTDKQTEIQVNDLPF